MGSFRRFLKKGHRDETRNRLVNRNFRASSRSLCRPRQADLRLGNSTLLLGKHAITTSRPLAKVVLFRQKRPIPTSTEAAPSDEKCKKYEKVETHQKTSKITKDSHYKLNKCCCNQQTGGVPLQNVHSGTIILTFTHIPNVF